MLASGSPHRPRTLQELISPEFCARLDRIDVLSRKIFAGKLQGERRSKRRGQSIEFEDYRNYVAGDDLRHVDWNVFARLDRLFVKVFQQEEDLSFHVVIDATASMDAGTPSKLVFALRVAMALSYVGIVNNNRLTVSVIDGKSVRVLGPVRGRRNVQRIASFILRSAWPSEEAGGAGGDGGIVIEAKGFAGTARVISQSRTGKGVMVVISDFLIPEGYEQGLTLVAGGGVGDSGFDVYCLQVLSPGEIDPQREVEGASSAFVGDLSLTDVETGRSAEITVSADLLKKYRATVADYIERLRAFCAARAMSHVLVASDADAQSLVLEHLRTRGLLR